MTADALTMDDVENQTAAPAPPRRRFTLAELDLMSDAGVFGEYEHVELIRGEIVQMSPKGSRHENLCAHLSHKLRACAPPELMVLQELGWRPDEGVYLEPDIVIAPQTGNVSMTAGSAILLMIEVAATSLSYDLEIKAPYYAALGVRELWVIDAEKLQTAVHLDPRAEGYATRHIRLAEETLAPSLLPDLKLALGDLELDGASDD